VVRGADVHRELKTRVGIDGVKAVGIVMRLGTRSSGAWRVPPRYVAVARTGIAANPSVPKIGIAGPATSRWWLRENDSRHEQNKKHQNKQSVLHLFNLPALNIDLLKSSRATGRSGKRRIYIRLIIDLTATAYTEKGRKVKNKSLATILSDIPGDARKRDIRFVIGRRGMYFER
jgi:hypothetical protein